MNPMVSLWLLSTGVFCMPLYIPYSLTGKWHLGRGICKLWLVMDYLLCTASVFNIVLISHDRFLSVTKAVSTPFRASLILFLGWLHSPTFAVLISPNLMKIIPLKNILACGDYQISCSQMGRIFCIELASAQSQSTRTFLTISAASCCCATA